MKNNISLNAVIKNGKIDYPLAADKQRLQNFLANTPEDANIEIFISVSDGKGSNAQLARIHAMCRELANEVGYTFDEMKLHIKEKAGLCYLEDGKQSCKSFAKCDKDELNLTIQACIEAGDFVGMNLR
jgi:hypothetical protein